MAKKSKKIQPVEFTAADLTTRNWMKAKPLSGALKPLCEFGHALSLKMDAAGKHRAPKIRGYRCTAAWKADHEDTTLLEFDELAEKLGNVQTLYHGTGPGNITSIAKEGLRPGRSSCMFGAGIYLGNINKAWCYTEMRWHGFGNKPGGRYILEVKAILGKIMECPSSGSHTLKELNQKGFNSVAGVAGMTASWNGTLRNSENVLYSPDQVLVTAVYEYQATTEESIYQEPKYKSGKCGLVWKFEGSLEAPVSPAWEDLIRMRVCGKTAVVERETTTENRTRVWICNDCIRKYNLKAGSTVQIKNTAYKGKPVISVRIK